MENNNKGVKRPMLYAVAAVFAIMMSIPLAISSGQTKAGGIFDECYGAACDAKPLLAHKTP